MVEAVEIVRLGAQGDGIAIGNDGERFVPFALPGERVRETPLGLPDLVSAPSADRRTPVCKHFGVCGGCVAQHMGDALYAEWKRNIVVDALRRRRIDVEVAPLARIPLASRRRAVLTATRSSDGIVLGYHRRKSHEVFAVEECPVLDARIVGQLATLKTLVATLQPPSVRLTVLATPAGLDVALMTENAARPSDVARLVRAAVPLSRIVRIALNGDTAFERARPMLAIDGANSVPPPGAFVQAVAEAEEAMADAILEAMPKAKRIADLFAGIGTFTLRLLRGARVLAVDSDRSAIAALEIAVRQTPGLRPMEARVRDLFRDPLSPRELDAFDAVVFDPPYAGAKAQAEALARSKVPTVAPSPATQPRSRAIYASFSTAGIASIA